MLTMEELREKRKNEHRVSCKEFIYLFANRLFFSQFYAIFYVSMILVNLVIIAWMVASGGYPESAAFLALEILVTAALGFEILIKMITQRKSYCQKATNWFDFFVMVMCVAALVIYSQGPSALEEADEVLSISLLVLRYITQGLRLALLLRHQQAMDQLTGRLEQGTDDVDFGIIEDPDIDMYDNKKGDLSRKLGLHVPLSSSLQMKLFKKTAPMSNSVDPYTITFNSGQSEKETFVDSAKSSSVHSEKGAPFSRDFQQPNQIVNS